MLDHPGSAPDLDLLLSPGDEAECSAVMTWRTRCGRVERCSLHLVLHRPTRSLDPSLPRGAGPPARAISPAFLERAEEGDRRAALRAWIDMHPSLAA
jgi:hypothetical protein